MHKLLIKKYFVAYIAIYILMGFVVIYKGPIYLPDSYAFLDMLINRSPVYAVFLKFFTTVFGNYYQYPLLIAQYLLLVFSINFLLKILYEKIKLTFISVLFVQFIFLANAIYWFAAVNKILSEALTFPLLLFLIGFMYKSFVDTTFKSIFQASMILVLLEFTRGQFIAFLPLLILLVIYLIFKTKKYIKGIVTIFLICLIPLFVSLSERFYNNLVHHQYMNYTMTYVHFITLPFYIAKSSDVEVFETEEEKMFFSRTFKILQSKNITRDFAVSINADDYAFYENNFTEICNASIHESNMEYYRNQGVASEYEQQYKVDEMTTKMFLPLLKANYKVWLKIVFKSFEKGLGGRSGTFLTGLIFLCGLMFFFKDYRFSFFALAILMKLSNGLIIAMVVHSIVRYTFYFDWIVSVAIIFLVDPILKKFYNVS